ncbi:MAG TPA: VOC family protein [Candidatus Binatia bacterium]|nr:VOC family protein [Candidatus Binatia bacterium]
MQHRSLFPVIITPALAAARDFYVQYLGFHAVFDSDWHVQLRAMRADGGVPLELAFMSPDLVSQPFPLRSAFNGQGMLVTIEVNDVDALYQQLREAGYEMLLELQDEPWGQRHFLLRDPSGTLLDVVKQIPPSSEYVIAYADHIKE